MTPPSSSTRADGGPYLDRGAHRPGRAALVHPDRARVHDRVSHAVSGIHSRRAPVPLAVSYAFMRWFHGAAKRTLVATPSMRRAARGAGLRNLDDWSRGRGQRVVPAARQEFPVPAAPDLALPRTCCGGEGHRRFPGPTCRAPSSWSGTGRARVAAARFPEVAIRRLQARRGPRRDMSRPATYSSFQVVRTRSDSCCLRRWPVACLSPPTRSPAQSTSS